MNDADVAVIGLGAIGAMSAWRLAASGAAVHGYERFGIAHDRGASAGQTRRFSVQSQGDPRFARLAVLARELWLVLEAETSMRLLEPVGGLIIGASGVLAFDNAVASARHFSLPYELMTHDEVVERFPQHVVAPDEVAVLDPLGGYIRPELAVLTAARRAAALGAELHDNTPVGSIQPDEHGVAVTSALGTLRYERVVVATGYWARQLLPFAARSVLPRRLLQTWFAAEDPASYAPDVFPVFERVGARAMFGFPSLDGTSVKVVPRLGEHPVVQELDHPDGWISPRTLQNVRQAIGEALRGLHPSPIATSLGFEGYTVDKRPLLGPSPLSPRIVSAVGMSGSGFKFSPLFGDAAARYALGETEIPEVAFLSAMRDAGTWDGGLRSSL